MRLHAAVVILCNTRSVRIIHAEVLMCHKSWYFARVSRKPEMFHFKTSVKKTLMGDNRCIWLVISILTIYLGGWFWPCARYLQSYFDTNKMIFSTILIYTGSTHSTRVLKKMGIHMEFCCSTAMHKVKEHGPKYSPRSTPAIHQILAFSILLIM